MDSFSLTDALTVLVSARYNDVRIDLSGSHGDESVLPPGESGRHTFSRLNPAIGLTHIAGSGLTSYFSYSESSRVPTPAELTCHDETNPCALPNSFLADPPLDQVVAKTWEAGFRGANYDISWRLALYRTVNHDDIYFLLTQEGPGLSPGFFSSIGETQRSGVELSLQADYESWRWSFHYSRINAKFKDSFELRSENNPFSLENDLEVLEVTNGSHLPGIPDHLARLGIDWLPTSRHLIGIDAIYNSGSYFRGDEANVSGRISGYTIINLRGRYRVNDHLEIFIKVENLLDQQFESFGLYGDPGEAPGLDNLADTRFLSPGAPRGAWIGLRFDI
jgi:outer membrane receptor protein involved in Fe transport